MTTIQIEAEVSTEQLLHAVEQLPPQEFAAFLAHLLTRVRGAAAPPSVPGASRDVSISAGSATGSNPYLAAAGMFADDAFAVEVEAYINAQRECEREEAAHATET